MCKCTACAADRFLWFTWLHCALFMTFGQFVGRSCNICASKFTVNATQLARSGFHKLRTRAFTWKERFHQCNLCSFSWLSWCLSNDVYLCFSINSRITGIRSSKCSLFNKSRFVVPFLTTQILSQFASQCGRDGSRMRCRVKLNFLMAQLGACFLR